MRRTLRNALLAAGAVAVLVALVPNRAMAQSTTKGPFYDSSEGEQRARKFFRGVANVTLAVAEIPNQAFQEAYRTSPVTGTVVGAGKGVYKGVQRFVIGICMLRIGVRAMSGV